MRSKPPRMIRMNEGKWVLSKEGIFGLSKYNMGKLVKMEQNYTSSLHSPPFWREGFGENFPSPPLQPSKGLGVDFLH